MISHLDDQAATPKPESPGIFVVFEGGDGVGKSTQARILAERLTAAYSDVVLTREPGGTELGEKIRSLLLDHGHGEIDPHTEALLYAASRSAHAHQIIGPALRRGGIVICDRYIESSTAYQGAGRGLGEEAVTNLSRWATEDTLPDLTIYLTLPLTEARDRAAGRGLTQDRLESEPDSFHARIRDSFARLAVSGPGRAVIDASGSVEEVSARVWDAFARAFPEAAARSLPPEEKTRAQETGS